MQIMSDKLLFADSVENLKKILYIVLYLPELFRVTIKVNTRVQTIFIVYN